MWCKPYSFLGGVPQLIPGSDDHPGFDNTIRLYHTITQSLIKKEVAPYPISVTTNIAQKGNTFFIGSGEIKPGIRTSHILKGEIIPFEKKLGIVNTIVIIYILHLLPGLAITFRRSKKIQTIISKEEDDSLGGLSD